MFIRWKKSPPRKDGDFTWYAELVEAARFAEVGPRQRVLAYLGSIRARALRTRDREATEAFWKSARQKLRELTGEVDRRSIEEQLSRTLSPRKRPRDSQRSKLYKAEGKVKAGSNVLAMPECQDYVDRVLRSRWWRTRYPAITEIVVTDGRGRRSAAAYQDRAAIALPRRSRTRSVILHELAHHATPRTFAAHGPEFARTFLELTRHFEGKDAAQELREAFDSHRVKVAD